MVVIIIVDVNDNFLVFNLRVLFLLVIEFVLKGIFVICVFVRDVDLDLDGNNRYLYSMDFIILFKVYFIIGIVIVDKLLDCEIEDRYVILFRINVCYFMIYFKIFVVV